MTPSPQVLALMQEYWDVQDKLKALQARKQAVLATLVAKLPPGKYHGTTVYRVKASKVLVHEHWRAGFTALRKNTR